MSRGGDPEGVTEETSEEEEVEVDEEVEIDHLETALYHARLLDLVRLIQLAAAVAFELQLRSLEEEHRRRLENLPAGPWRNQVRSTPKGKGKGKGKGFSLNLPHKGVGRGSRPY